MPLNPEEIHRQRRAFLVEVKSWIRTPYHDLAALKGQGADCKGLLQGTAENAGLIPRGVDFGFYKPNQNQHRGEEVYLDGVLRFCNEVPGPPERMPISGDLVMWKFGRIFWHVAIIDDWPTVIHSHFSSKGVDYIDVSQTNWLNFIGENVKEKGNPRPRKFFVFKDWC